MLVLVTDCYDTAMYFYIFVSELLFVKCWCPYGPSIPIKLVAWNLAPIRIMHFGTIGFPVAGFDLIAITDNKKYVFLASC